MRALRSGSNMVGLACIWAATTPTGTRPAMIATAEEGYPVSTPHVGWSEQDPADWWRAAQACLVYLGYDPHGVDGGMGDHTRTCLTQFQTAAGLPATGRPDAACLAALKARAGV